MLKMTPKKRNFLFLTAVIVLLSLISFFLGRLSVLENDSGGVEIYYPDVVEVLTQDEGHMKVYASRNGSRYYFDWCSSQVKDSNKIYFDSEDLAERAGYTLASGCHKY